jgi:hypothetical protein
VLGVGVDMVAIWWKEFGHRFIIVHIVDMHRMTFMNPHLSSDVNSRASDAVIACFSDQQ